MNTMLSLLAHTKEDFFMLYTAVTNDWGETTYIPTTLGNVLLVIILAALLAAAVLFARMQMKKTAAAPASSDGDSRMKHGKLTVKQLAFCAMAIALGTVLSNIKLFHFPTGGSITLLSMLVICLPGYWFGRLSLAFFSSKHLRGLYFLGGICGGLLYMLAYNVFPYFQDAVYSSYLLGASASVLAIVVAVSVREPNYPVQFLFIGTVRLKYVALFMVVLDLLFMTSDNAGGHIAHLGGALAGWWFAAGLQSGHDATKWINLVCDWFAGLRRPVKRKPKMKVHYGGRQADYEYNARKKEREAEIDRILDKLRKSGYNSLTDDEKKSLFDASKK